jgi:hypothetical protein
MAASVGGAGNRGGHPRGCLRQRQNQQGYALVSTTLPPIHLSVVDVFETGA